MFRLCAILLTAIMIPSATTAVAAPPATGPAPFRQGPCDGFNRDYFSNPECDTLMMADPAPPVAPLAVDHGAVASYTYMHITGTEPLVVYNAPNGTPLYEIAPGFNFVTPRSTQGEWVEINAGEWANSAYLEAVLPSMFTGVLIQAEPARAFGWFLRTMYTSERPGGPAIFRPENHVQRYQVTYVYASTTVDDVDWYLVGPGQWIEQWYVGLAQRTVRPLEASGRWLAVDLYEQTLVAYENDTMVFATLVSSGLPGTSTAEGTFQVWGQRLNGPMTGAEGRSDYYRLENVPYALYFDGDTSLHGTYWHDGFGYRRSHGCVNLSITDAHWLYTWLDIDGWVHVYYSQPY
ncbi:MAG: L,D-transpeptidase [Chloroflexi bacterium]|nr:L,D-transpeptidase [Chloroflexota bacterium]